MPLAAPIAAALTDGSAHPFTLTVGGLDVIKEFGGGFGVPLESIEVVEAGPGNVSSMRFLVEDPGREFSVPSPVEVFFVNNTTGNVYFRGFTDRASPTPDFGGQGRTWDVQCSGLEILLDWMIVPVGYVPTTVSGQVTLQQQIGLMVQQFAPMLRAPVGPPYYTDASYTRSGDFLHPVGTMARNANPVIPVRVNVTGIAVTGGTLRKTINDMLQDAVWYDASALQQVVDYGVNALYTVDFYYGFRSWDGSAGLQPDDYTTLTISDTYAGPNRAAGLSAEIDWSGIIRSVYVAGVDAASSGTFGDGSGKIGQGTVVSDTSITTFDGARARAFGVMAASAAQARGRFTLEDWTPTDTVHAGSLVSITDVATDVASTYRITEIRKNFRGNGRQDWAVTFGELPPKSAAKEVKRLINTARGVLPGH